MAAGAIFLQEGAHLAEEILAAEVLEVLVAEALAEVVQAEAGSLLPVNLKREDLRDDSTGGLPFTVYPELFRT